MKRRLPRPREVAPLLQFRKPQLRPTRRRLDAALTIDDLRRIAKRRTPKAAFDYTDGAAEEELSLARARRAFRDIEFHPPSCAMSPRSIPEPPCSATAWHSPSGSRRPVSPV